MGNRHQVIVADVSVPADCQRLIDQAVAHHGRLDTVVCNAGYGLAKATADVTADEMRQIFQTNVFGTADVIRQAVPVMADQPDRDGYRGQLVVVSSVVARRGLPFSGAYAATKAAQLSLAEALRVELKPSESPSLRSTRPGPKPNFLTSPTATATAPPARSPRTKFARPPRPSRHRSSRRSSGRAPKSGRCRACGGASRSARCSRAWWTKRWPTIEGRCRPTGPPGLANRSPKLPVRSRCPSPNKILSRFAPTRPCRFGRIKFL